MTDEQNMYGAQKNPEESESAFWAAARRVRTKLLQRLRTSPPASGLRGPFLIVMCKSCHLPFRTQVDRTTLKVFENIEWRITYTCPYCDEGNSYEVQDHFPEPVGGDGPT